MNSVVESIRKAIEAEIAQGDLAVKSFKNAVGSGGVAYAAEHFHAAIAGEEKARLLRWSRLAPDTEFPHPAALYLIGRRNAILTILLKKGWEAKSTSLAVNMTESAKASAQADVVSILDGLIAQAVKASNNET